MWLQKVPNWYLINTYSFLWKKLSKNVIVRFQISCWSASSKEHQFNYAEKFVNPFGKVKISKNFRLLPLQLFEIPDVCLCRNSVFRALLSIKYIKEEGAQAWHVRISNKMSFAEEAFSKLGNSA